MRKSFVALVAFVAAIALSAPVATAAPVAATGNQTVGSATAADDASTTTARKARRGLKVKRSAKAYHSGMKPVKISVKGAGKGKAKFFIGKKKRKTKKLKRGKATWKMPKHLKPGKYKVRVKVGKRQGKTKVKVHNSQLKTEAVTYTYSLSNYSSTPVAGTVKWKGKWAKKGWVDFYRNGKKKGGSSSPNYAGMASVSGGKFSASSVLSRVASNWGVGTYTIQAFYTPTSSFAEYIHSAPITVVVTE